MPMMASGLSPNKREMKSNLIEGDDLIRGATCHVCQVSRPAGGAPGDLIGSINVLKETPEPAIGKYLGWMVKLIFIK
jgi:hypothetical protein